MRKSFLAVGAVLVVMVMLLSACSGGNDDGNTAAADPPEKYASLENPYAEDDADAAAAGESLYQTNCATCHGKTGKGDGVAGQALNPPATNLAAESGERTDGYLHWRIAEGGALPPFNSAMPAWKGVLSEEKIWQVITYIRTLD